MTTKKQARIIRKLALGTIGELDRRGWVKGTLLEDVVVTGKKLVKSSWDDKEYEQDQFADVAHDVARVCLVGAASSAFNPFHPDNPGMVHRDADYEAFLRAVIAELPKRYQTEVAKRDKALYISNSRVSDVVAEWNDQNTRTLKHVKAVLQKVADKHAPEVKA